MASVCTMTAPICLVENQKNLLMVNPEALKILGNISQPVVVVAIAGPYRTGKSYLMNRLAGQSRGFPLGSTVRSETKGIWMWCIPHPSKAKHTLVLLDTEGLGDVEKGDSKNDLWIFTLAILLSSVFVYNSMGTINRQALEQLHYVTELTKLIRTRSSPSFGEVDDSAEFVSFFPDFVWTVRDFTLELQLDGRPITSDQYLENALKLIPGEDPRIQNSNMPRECIRKFFPERKCFVFDRPINDKKLLQHIEEASEYQLELDFREQSKNFCSYIFAKAKTKTLREGITVTGNRESLLLQGIIEKNKEDFLLQNEEASVKYCQDELQRLSEPLMESISGGTFSVPGGHKLYLEALNKVKQDYELVPRKGVKGNEVLQIFLRSQAAVEASILQADKTLTDGEKALAAERAKNQAAEKEKELLRQKLKEQHQIMEAKERTFQENMAQLKEQSERELKIQKELLTEVFQKKSEQMNEEINKLKREIESSKIDDLSNILDVATMGLLTAVCPPFGLIASGMKCLSMIMKHVEKS
ncbi:guanylate-binding protein 7 isoform X5 [Equus caballus]|uniref:guanylate-binding protein 7 isoform X5 n=1 Tax=Equus caballus TaxID=9796 RepID=UPI000C9E8342|nr:guanylate-binding protein 4 isoform X5 [Equus caballus]